MLTLKERLRRLEHLRRRYAHRYGIWSQLVQFLLVGASGLVVNLALLTAFLALRTPDRLAVALAILLSMLWNFFLNRRFSFSHARGEPVLPQLARFVAACSVGAGVNFVVTSALWGAYHQKQLAAAFGVAAGTAFNFASSRLVVFVRRRVNLVSTGE